ncbi:MAG: hypothetical protein PHI58_05360 [Candidatus Omnitrophica bacterium]|nr:hypothetical protein [Candidatus Omnitrophota bacterium]
MDDFGEDTSSIPSGERLRPAAEDASSVPVTERDAHLAFFLLDFVAETDPIPFMSKKTEGDSEEFSYFGIPMLRKNFATGVVYVNPRLRWTTDSMVISSGIIASAGSDLAVEMGRRKLFVPLPDDCRDIREYLQELYNIDRLESAVSGPESLSLPLLVNRLSLIRLSENFWIKHVDLENYPLEGRLALKERIEELIEIEDGQDLGEAVAGAAAELEEAKITGSIPRHQIARIGSLIKKLEPHFAASRQLLHSALERLEKRIAHLQQAAVSPAPAAPDPRLEALLEHVKKGKAPELVTIDIRKSSDIVDDLMAGRVVVMDLAGLGSEDKPYAKVEQALIDVAYGIVSRMDTLYPEEYLEHLTEILKNAFVHGSKGFFDLPIILRVWPSQEDGRTIEVIDTATHREDENIKRELAANGLTGGGQGEKWISDAIYRRSNIYLNNITDTEHIMGTRATLIFYHNFAAFLERNHIGEVYALHTTRSQIKNACDNIDRRAGTKLDKNFVDRLFSGEDSLDLPLSAGPINIKQNYTEAEVRKELESLRRWDAKHSEASILAMLPKISEVPEDKRAEVAGYFDSLERYAKRFKRIVGSLINLLEKELATRQAAHAPDTAEERAVHGLIAFINERIPVIENLVNGIDSEHPDLGDLSGLQKNLNEIWQYPMKHIFHLYTARAEWIGQGIGGIMASVLNKFPPGSSDIDIPGLKGRLRELRDFVAALSLILEKGEFDNLERYKTKRSYNLDATPLLGRSDTSEPSERRGNAGGSNTGDPRALLRERIIDWKDVVGDRQKLEVVKGIIAQNNGRAAFYVHPIGKYASRPGLPGRDTCDAYISKLALSISNETGVVFILDDRTKGINDHLLNNCRTKAIVISVPSMEDDGVPNLNNMPRPLLAKDYSEEMRLSQWAPVIETMKNNMGVKVLSPFAGEQATMGQDGRVNELWAPQMGCVSAALYYLREHFSIEVDRSLIYFLPEFLVDGPLDGKYRTGIKPEKCSLEEAMRQMPYTPAWLDEPMLRDGRTPRMMILEDGELRKFIKGLEAKFAKMKKEDLILYHEVTTDSYEDAQKICREGPSSSWLTDKLHGKCFWTYEKPYSGPEINIRPWLKVSFNGYTLKEEGEDGDHSVDVRVGQFARKHFIDKFPELWPLGQVDIRAGTFQGYLYDLILKMHGVDATWYGFAESKTRVLQITEYRLGRAITKIELLTSPPQGKPEADRADKSGGAGTGEGNPRAPNLRIAARGMTADPLTHPTEEFFGQYDDLSDPLRGRPLHRHGVLKSSGTRDSQSSELQKNIPGNEIGSIAGTQRNDWMHALQLLEGLVSSANDMEIIADRLDPRTGPGFMHRIKDHVGVSEAELELASKERKGETGNHLDNVLRELARLEIFISGCKLSNKTIEITNWAKSYLREGKHKKSYKTWAMAEFIDAGYLENAELQISIRNFWDELNRVRTELGPVIERLAKSYYVDEKPVSEADEASTSQRQAAAISAGTGGPKVNRRAALGTILGASALGRGNPLKPPSPESAAEQSIAADDVDDPEKTELLFRMAKPYLDSYSDFEHEETYYFNNYLDFLWRQRDRKPQEEGIRGSLDDLRERKKKAEDNLRKFRRENHLFERYLENPRSISSEERAAINDAAKELVGFLAHFFAHDYVWDKKAEYYRPITHKDILQSAEPRFDSFPLRSKVRLLVEVNNRLWIPLARYEVTRRIAPEIFELNSTLKSLNRPDRSSGEEESFDEDAEDEDVEKISREELSSPGKSVERIHAENLRHPPAVSPKTIYCDIVTDCIIPEEQRPILTNVEFAMRHKSYNEKIVRLTWDGSGDFEAAVRKCAEKTIDYYRREYGDEFKDYTFKFAVACPGMDEVNAILGSDLGRDMKVKAMAFKRYKAPVQVEGIMLALRALQSENIADLRSAFEFLAKRKLTDDELKKATVDEFVRSIVFILPIIRFIDTGHVMELNHLIRDNIKTAA